MMIMTTYTAASLETAACLWEAVLALEASTDVGGVPTPVAAAIEACRDAMGTNFLRLTVIGWTDRVDAAWRAVDTNDGKEPRGGVYGQRGQSFDWDFVPGWIDANVDWSDPTNPSVKL